MRTIRFIACMVLAVAAALPQAVQAQAPDRGFGIGNDYVKFRGRMQSLFLWRNDRDFDRTPPFYNAQDQDVGVLGTFFAPYLEITPVKELRIVAELELGLNLWSMQDPDVYDAGDEHWFRLAIRQLYTEGRFLDGRLGFRAGYEQLFDPSGLYLGHWLGAASLTSAWKWGRVALTVGQVPDQTFEGVAFDANNFNTDTIVYGLRFDLPFDRLGLSLSAWGMHDTQVIRQTMDLMTLTARFSGEWDTLKFGIDAGLQYGVTQGRASGGDETTVAWSAQGSLDWRQPLRKDLAFRLQFNQLALSGDDDHDGNAFNGAWFYSGKSRSRTMILTEDELRDRGGNLDERLAERRHGDRGKFWLARPGLSVTDLSLGLDVADFFKPLLTLGTAFTLNPDNALGGRFVGFETDLHLEFVYRKYLSFDLVGSYLLPGKAAAAFVNRTGNRTSTDGIWQVEASLTAWF